MENSSFFPLFVNLLDKKCLVIGAGKIGLRKVKTLVEFGANVTVVAPDILEEVLELDVRIKIRKFEKRDINNRYILIVAATDSEKLNEEIVSLCNEKNILVNNITSKDKMSARFSANIEHEKYQIAISAKGNPKESVKLKKDIIEYLNKKN